MDDNAISFLYKLRQSQEIASKQFYEDTTNDNYELLIKCLHAAAFEVLVKI